MAVTAHDSGTHDHFAARDDAPKCVLADHAKWDTSLPIPLCEARPLERAPLSGLHIGIRPAPARGVCRRGACSEAASGLDDRMM